MKLNLCNLGKFISFVVLATYVTSDPSYGKNKSSLPEGGEQAIEDSIIEDSDNNSTIFLRYSNVKYNLLSSSRKKAKVFFNRLRNLDGALEKLTEMGCTDFSLQSASSNRSSILAYFFVSGSVVRRVSGVVLGTMNCPKAMHAKIELKSKNVNEKIEFEEITSILVDRSLKLKKYHVETGKKSKSLRNASYTKVLSNRIVKTLQDMNCTGIESFDKVTDLYGYAFCPDELPLQNIHR